MNILFYTPFNLRSRDTESLMEAFIQQGHSVFLLTQAEDGIYHEYCRKIGVKTATHVIKKNNTLSFFIKHTLHLIKFCKKNKIDVLYAHLETAGLPAVLSQPFITAKVFACRHIINEAYLFNSRNFIILTKIVYYLAKNIIVVSNHCKQFMIDVEGVKEHKIKVIFLAYNFDLYNQPNKEVVNEIKNRFTCDLLLLTACRLIAPKRTEIAINVVKKLRNNGLNVKLIILGTGPDYEKLNNYIQSEKLSDCVFMEGFKLNVMDYLQAADILINPSVADSSSVIIKEAGLNKKIVIACSGIGDADDYLISGTNSFLASPSNTETEMVDIIKHIYNTEKEKRQIIGETLYNSVLERFSIKSILPIYNQIHQNILNNKL